MRFVHQRVAHTATWCSKSATPYPTTDNPDTPMDPTRAGSSTPSRKRSRWEDGEDEDIPRQPSPKRVPKLRRSKISDCEPSSSSTPPRPRPIPSTNKLHSVCVPPRTCHPPILPARSVFVYERLNQIEEGSYGVVFRARDTKTGDIVALKRLKLEEEKHGFPITALREINALMACRHEHVVNIREVVVGETLTQ